LLVKITVVWPHPHSGVGVFVCSYTVAVVSEVPEVPGAIIVEHVGRVKWVPAPEVPFAEQVALLDRCVSISI
jgi:hypothetical protein